MIIFPAIDIKDGKVVRLLQGKFEAMTHYGNDPVAMALEWERQGAQWLHVVDLDGALTGETKNLEIILNIAQSVRIPIQVGGGLRRQEDVMRLLTGGVQRAILGTKAIEDRSFLKELLASQNNQIAVSLDCSKGIVMQRGWTSSSEIKALDLAQELEQMGLSCLIYTDIARDGMLAGPNLDAIQDLLSKINIPLIASGGISSLEDLKMLAALEPDGLIGAITGKAIYEGRFKLKDALQLC
ncbi:MAG: 1-(5-phosphoribosyl)-5-[(5-phosphoribosylamino)methylideneamino]imidazole-4-carboxamide isomerase [Candidatus Omnitrophota bacterium]|nr:1-(5-phosphoribosyl)-5-[(5-phosphoribosylamino)methylideneamino]imidazole-4-carboxamide isomerase [Candidatus Omnitrophota bacterium]